LERRKIYVAIPDPRAEKLDQIRVIDESGEDYLYPAGSFVSLTLPGLFVKLSCRQPNNAFEWTVTPPPSARVRRVGYFSLSARHGALWPAAQRERWPAWVAASRSSAQLAVRAGGSIPA